MTLPNVPLPSVVMRSKSVSEMSQRASKDCVAITTASSRGAASVAGCCWLFEDIAVDDAVVDEEAWEGLDAELCSGDFCAVFGDLDLSPPPPVGEELPSPSESDIGTPASCA